MSEPAVETAEAVTSKEALSTVNHVTTRRVVGNSELDETLFAVPNSVANFSRELNEEIKKVAKESGVPFDQILKNEAKYRDLLKTVGFLPVQPEGKSFAPSFQIQAAFDKTAPSVLGRAIGAVNFKIGNKFTVELDRIQLAARVLFGTPRDYVNATLRLDAKNKLIPQQLNLDVQHLFRQPRKFGKLIQFDGISAILNADAATTALKQKKGGTLFNQRSRGAIGEKGIQVGLAGKGKLFDVPTVFEGLLVVDFDAAGISCIDMTDPNGSREISLDLARVVSLGVNGQIFFSLNNMPSLIKIPALEKFFNDAGIQVTFAVKVFFRIFATKQGWLSLAGLAARAAAFVGEAAVVVGEGAVAAGGFLAANAGVAAAVLTLATVVLTARGIYIDLKTPNFLPMLTRYAAGYGDQLGQVLEMDEKSLFAALVVSGTVNTALVAERIRAVMRREGPQSSSSNVIVKNSQFLAALDDAEVLGRCAALGVVSEFIKAHGDRPESWFALQKRYKEVLLPALRRRGYSSFRKWCIELLTLRITRRDQDIHSIDRTMGELEQDILSR